jgi:hypothetical protein
MTAAPATILRKRRRGCFDFEAKRRREIVAHALHVGAAETEDFDRPLIAWHWHNQKAKDPIWSLIEAARQMGGDISEAEAVEITQQASAYPKRLSADALGAWLGVTYAQREVLRITTIGAANVKKRARKDLRKRKDRLYQEQKRRERGARPQAQSLSRTKPWEAAKMSRARWYRQQKLRRETTSSAPIFLYLADSFVSPSLSSPSLSSRTATLIAVDETSSSALERRLQAVPRPPDYDPVGAALERRSAYRNGGRR